MEENTNVMENPEMLDGSTDLVPMDEEFNTEDMGGIGSVLIGLGKGLLMLYGGFELGSNVAQTIYVARQKRRNKAVLCRERFYQVWRPKGPKVQMNKNVEIIEADTTAVTEDGTSAK